MKELGKRTNLQNYPDSWKNIPAVQTHLKTYTCSIESGLIVRKQNEWIVPYKSHTWGI